MPRAQNDSLRRILGNTPRTLTVEKEPSLSDFQLLLQQALNPAAAATTGQGIQAGQIAGEPATTALQPQPITPAQPAQADVPAALGAAQTEAQPMVQPILPAAAQAVPDFVGNVLAPRSEQISAETSDVVQTLNGVQGPGIEGVAPLEGEISDVAAEKGPGALAKFGEFATAISGELATNPILQDLLGQVAQALTAKSPAGFPFQLASSIREYAQGAQQDIVRQSVLDVLAGRTPDERADPNRLTLSPELRKQGQIAGLNEFSAAIAGQAALADIETPEERALEFQLSTAQLQATQALTNKRNLEMLEILSGAGVEDQFTSTHLGLLRFINNKASEQAALIAGTTGIGIGPDGRPNFLYKDPIKANEIIKQITNTEITALVDVGELPESAMLLTSRDVTGKPTPVPNVQDLDTTTQPPSSVTNDKRLGTDPKFMGSKKEANTGKTIWYFDTNGDGKIDQGVRK